MRGELSLVRVHSGLSLFFFFFFLRLFFFFLPSLLLFFWCLLLFLLFICPLFLLTSLFNGLDFKSFGGLGVGGRKGGRVFRGFKKKKKKKRVRGLGFREEGVLSLKKKGKKGETQRGGSLPGFSLVL